MRTLVAGSIVALSIPLIAFAQTNDALRAQIRADIQKDPRSAQMSSAEIDALVSALADQAEKEGTSESYMSSQNTFD